jgi:hypothetical protein
VKSLGNSIICFKNVFYTIVIQLQKDIVHRNKIAIRWNQNIKAQQHTDTANSWVDQAVEQVYQTKQHFQDHWQQTKGTLEYSSSMKNCSNSMSIYVTIYQGIKTYTLMTLLSLLQVTWNHVQGLTSVGSQLCKTLLGSCKFVLKLCKASPVSKHKNI